MASPWKKLLERSLASSRNLAELVRVGRLGTPYRAPFEIVDEGPHHRLRRYATCANRNAPIALLVPPLMVTSDVYDIDRESSAVTKLGADGVQPYVIDFGAPERERGGMTRTLDDHVLAVARAIEFLTTTHQRDVHLLGYSQGGMFAYQCCAFVRSRGVKSVVTFGSPVDLHKNLPAIHKDAVAALVRVLEPMVEFSIARIEGLPGILTSTAFKIVSTKKEIEQRLEFLAKLHDRKALERREARRRFLNGEGFVAWPGPAFREFVEQFIVHNRMLSGGFILDGRTVTLADITCPILAFIGAHDDMARPPTIRAITKAAPRSEVSFMTVPAGHFGIVVGSGAVQRTWPTVSAWIKWKEGLGDEPRALAKKKPVTFEDEPEEGAFDPTVELTLFVDALATTARAFGERVGEVANRASDVYDSLRYQEPRLRALAELGPETLVSPAKALADARERDPSGVFFLYRDRAFSYEAAGTRVDNITKGLFHTGVRPKQRVGVLMESRPSFLSLVTALSNLGAVSVIAPKLTPKAELSDAFHRVEIDFLATDLDNLNTALDVTSGPILLLGGGNRKAPRGYIRRTDTRENVIDLEAIDVAPVKIPDEFPLGRARARDLSMILLRPTSHGPMRAAPIDNHRWALTALGAAAACTLKPEDTVYSGLPLDHPSGILLGVGSALAGGARFALGDPDARAEEFLTEIRRTGATVAFYAGEMLRPLVHSKPSAGDRHLPLRLFAGSGMRPRLAEAIFERYGVRTLEFYAATTERVVMADVRGRKMGALGKPLPGSDRIAVVKADVETGTLLRDTEGRLVRCGVDEPGVLLCALERGGPHDRRTAADGPAIVRDAFEQGDVHRASGDVVRIDADGDHWFVDHVSGFVRTASGMVSTRLVEDAFYALPEVHGAAAFQEDGAIIVAIVARDASTSRVAEAVLTLSPRDRPARVVEIESLRLTEGCRPERERLPRTVREMGRVVWPPELAEPLLLRRRG